VKIQPQWVVTSGKQTNIYNSFAPITRESFCDGQEMCTTPGFTLITVQSVVFSPLVYRCYINSLLASQQKRVTLLNNHSRLLWNSSDRKNQWVVCYIVIYIFIFISDKQIENLLENPFLLSQVTLEHFITMSQH